MDILDTLVTDRTQEDAAARNEKGTYQAADLNRVETAVGTIALQMRALPDEMEAYAASKGIVWEGGTFIPYDPAGLDLEVKTDWNMTDIPDTAQMDRYLANVVTLCGAIDRPVGELPGSMEYLTWSGANSIEKSVGEAGAAYIALREELKKLLDNTAAAWHYSGELYAGENG